MYHNEHEDQYENEAAEGGLKSRLGRWLDRMRGGPEEDDAVYDDPQPAGVSAGRPVAVAPEPPARRQQFRVASAREATISVTVVTNFGDTQRVADRLKSGEPQVVNLEKATPEVAERLIDFLNGVTYALDGYVEKVSEGAYLFTPAHIAIHAEGPEQAQPKPFFDRL